MIGLGVYDALAQDIVDADTGEIYPAISCCNNQEMASRCSSMDAEKVIWSIKANAQFNSDCAYLLREGFKNGRIRLLCNEYDGEELLGEIKGFSSLNPPEKAQLLLPYINTTLLIDEITKLQYEENGGKVKIYERSGMRKDRYSSLAYNYYVAIQLESKMRRRQVKESSVDSMFAIRPPKYNRKVVSMSSGRNKYPSWV